LRLSGFCLIIGLKIEDQMPCEAPFSQCNFEIAHQKWIVGDLAGFLALFDDDILWRVNIDGINAPFASSALGKEDLRWRLQHMMDVFHINGFAVESLEHGPDCCRSVVRLDYVHKATNEPLNVKVRFTGWAENGRFVRFEERADAAYVDSYTRFVRYLENSAK
jgi:ketosteroid isomerase-like protein